jgi:hypothetical protein
MAGEKDYPEILHLAFRDALQALVAEGKERVRPTDLVFYVLQRAMTTMKKLPDPEAALLYSMRSLWPEFTRTQEERMEAYRTELAAIEAGHQSNDSLLRTAQPTPRDVQRMHVIFDVFPKLLVGKNRRRDYQIICGMAAGKEGQQIARSLGLHRNSVYERRDLQMVAIAHKLKAVMPADDQIDAALASHGLEAAALEARLMSLG